MTTETTIAQRMPAFAGTIGSSVPSIKASPRRDSLQLPRSSWSRVALEVAIFLSTVAACIGLAMATYAWMSKVDAVTYIPSYLIDAPLSAEERAP